MQLIPLNQVHFPSNRQRKTVDQESLRRLADSIQSHGLIHLPVMREGVAYDLAGVTLVVGWRRLRAMEILWDRGDSFSYCGTPIPHGQVPHDLFTDLPDLVAREIELEENVRRIDLTWQERVTAEAELHKLRVEQNPAHTEADTAVELGRAPSSAATVKDRVILAGHLDDKDVRSATSEAEALKVLKRKLQREYEAELGRRMEHRIKTHTVRQVDAVEGMAALDKHSFDVILMDPPYGISAHKFGRDRPDGVETIHHEYKDDWTSVKELMGKVAQETWRVAKPKAHLYCFCDIKRYIYLAQLFSNNHWFVWPMPLIWVKDVGHIPMPNHGPQRTYECILFALMGMKMTRELRTDVLVYPAVKHAPHAAQKPTELYVDLLFRSTIVGDAVLDPFCGSGTIFEAANTLGLVATGFDTDAHSIGMSREKAVVRDEETRNA